MPVKHILSNWQPATSNLLRQEAERLPLWLPVPMMAGIAAYFGLAHQPPVWFSPVLLLACAALMLLRPLRFMVMPLCVACMGFAAADMRTHMLAMPLLQEEVHNRDVTGDIANIMIQERGGKLVLSGVSIEGVSTAQTPLRLQVSLKKLETHGGAPLHIGERVRLRANLFPLPEPTTPGAYDFALYLYFQGIGAVGFSHFLPDVIAALPPQGQWLTRFRLRLGQDMIARLGPEVGSIAAALTVGEENAVPQAARDALRDSGLYHILSISGVHLSIAAGILFFSLRLLLALYPPVGLRLPVKKIAAAFALIGTFFYLLAAGMPVPAQRSFIAVAFVLTAVLFDRQAISLRSLAFAAMLILALQPESLLGASFQMSFAATLAIVALYERYGSVLHRPQLWWPLRMAYGVMAVGLVSVVATLATAPFVITHFNRFQGWGVLANLLVEPLNAFVIMPGVVLSFLLLPLHLEGIGYAVLGWGVQGMMAVARFVASLPYASVLVYAFSDAGFAAGIFGFLWLCLWSTRLRFLGIALMLLGACTMLLHDSPDVFIGGDARQVMVRTPEGGYAMLKGSGRSFAAQAWLRSEGQAVPVPRTGTDMVCDKIQCSYRGVVVLKHPPEGLEAACASNTKLLVAWWHVKREQCRGPAILIGRAELEAHGAHTLWLNPQRIKRVWEHDRGGRPWEVAPSDSQMPEED